MEYRKIEGVSLPVSPVCLGTWAFGGDAWWGPQVDKNSVEVLDATLKGGTTIIDTAPVYGRGRSEQVIGGYIKKRRLREKVIIATKLGLSWQGSKILHNLKRERMLKEVDESRKRLKTDYFDLYQVHWPDPDTAIEETAQTMYSFYKKGITKSIGVSNYSVEQMKKFMEHCPLHCLQPEYSMFKRDIEDDIVPFCIENNIAIISYAPLYSGLLTGKFFLDRVSVPSDTNRKLKKAEFGEPRFSINKDLFLQLKEIASFYGKDLAQLAINWNFSQRGITSAIVGMRNAQQAKDNLGSLSWVIRDSDRDRINSLLEERLEKIKKSKK